MNTEHRENQPEELESYEEWRRRVDGKFNLMAYMGAGITVLDHLNAVPEGSKELGILVMAISWGILTFRDVKESFEDGELTTSTVGKIFSRVVVGFTAMNPDMAGRSAESVQPIIESLASLLGDSAEAVAKGVKGVASGGVEIIEDTIKALVENAEAFSGEVDEERRRRLSAEQMKIVAHFLINLLFKVGIPSLTVSAVILRITRGIRQAVQRKSREFFDSATEVYQRLPSIEFQTPVKLRRNRIDAVQQQFETKDDGQQNARSKRTIPQVPPLPSDPRNRNTSGRT